MGIVLVTGSLLVNLSEIAFIVYFFSLKQQFYRIVALISTLFLIFIDIILLKGFINVGTVIAPLLLTAFITLIAKPFVTPPRFPFIHSNLRWTISTLLGLLFLATICIVIAFIATISK